MPTLRAWLPMPAYDPSFGVAPEAPGTSASIAMVAAAVVIVLMRVMTASADRPDAGRRVGELGRAGGAVGGGVVENLPALLTTGAEAPVEDERVPARVVVDREALRRIHRGGVGPPGGALALGQLRHRG